MTMFVNLFVRLKITFLFGALSTWFMHHEALIIVIPDEDIVTGIESCFYNVHHFMFWFIVQ